MLKVIQNCLMVVELLAKKQTRFWDKKSTAEQIFNSPVLTEKHLQHGKDLYHNFINFKKAFDRVWHGVQDILWTFNVEALVHTIKALYDGSRKQVLFNNQVVKFFPLMVGICKG